MKLASTFRRNPLVLLGLAFLTMAGMSPSPASAEMILVGQGVSPAPVVVFQNAPPRTLEAATLLADYIGKISGQKPAVIQGEPATLPERAIWVGYQPVLKTLFPATDFEFKHPEEILIKANDKHVVIAGRDRWDPAKLDITTREGIIRGKQQEYGTINAVLTFLQDHLGVRWFWPGDLGEDVPRRDTLILGPLDHRYHPQILSRGGLFNFSSLGNKGYGKSHEWTLRQRLQLDSFETPGGHGFGDWWDRYHSMHPEIFALQPDGTRSGFPNPHNAKLCMSNPKVWELWLENVAEALAKDPHLTVFNASPNDGWASGHCVCANCSAWDHPDGEPRVFNWYKRNEKRPATSDRDVTFANKLAALLKEKYPGKNYRVLILSYGHSRPVPVKARPADNVIMSLVANFLGRTGLVDRGSTRGDTYRQQFEGWSKILPAMIWRPNTGSPVGWQQGLPDLSVRQTIQDFKDVAAANCIGVFVDAIWEHWATLGPQHYVMAQLTWNPRADADAILNDYYSRAFGPAAGPVREYFEELEAARMAITRLEPDMDVFEFPRLYTSELLAQSQARLDRALEAAPAGSIYARRVAFIQAGLAYTKLVVANISLMDGYWKKKDPAAAAQVLANWAEIEKVIASQPGAINAGPVRATSPRMQGLHPDHPPAKKKKVKNNDLDLN